jgi:hypothetical protein
VGCFSVKLITTQSRCNFVVMGESMTCTLMSIDRLPHQENAAILLCIAMLWLVLVMSEP